MAEEKYHYYTIAFNHFQDNSDKVSGLITELGRWRYDFGGYILLRTKTDIEDLHKLLKPKMNWKYFIAEIDPQKTQGMMSQMWWDHVKYDLNKLPPSPPPPPPPEEITRDGITVKFKSIEAEQINVIVSTEVTEPQYRILSEIMDEMLKDRNKKGHVSPFCVLEYPEKAKEVYGTHYGIIVK